MDRVFWERDMTCIRDCGHFQTVKEQPKGSSGLSLYLGNAPVTQTAFYLQLAETNLGIAVAV